ncbi:MAG: family transcriptional regulator, cyclic receptor protein [Thermoanaerobaculia bacterium]|jgi:CRP/FNR family transcriptional regulator|nr:family transcriptional regulator, cyclic receptor protein [Thermoanaerobaculia bacterium]
MPRVFDTSALVTFVTCKQTSRVYPPGSVLFSEGDMPKGLHILDSGRVKLFGSTSRGKTFITKIASAGEMLGLNAVILGRPYLLSAEAMEPSRVSHVVRGDFLEFLRKSPEASRHVIEQLSVNYYDSQREIRTLNLSSSMREKFARLIVSWVEDSDGGSDDAIWINLDLTHEQIGQMLGASRETISRVIAALSRMGVIKVQGHVLEIPSVVKLRELAKL